MKKHWSVILVAVLIVAAAGSDTRGEPVGAPDTRQDPPPQVDEVLAHYARACGGDALAAITTEIRRGVVVRGAGGPVPCEIVSSAPDRWCWTQTLAWGDRFRYGCDGSRSWVQDGSGVREMDPGQARDLQLLFALTSSRHLRELYPDLSVGGTEQIGERDAVILRARSADGEMTELAFDRENGLLLRAGEIYLEDYRPVGEVTRPFRLRLGEMLRLQFTAIRHDPAVDDSLFTVPTAPLPGTDPAIYRKYDEIEVGVEALEACVGEYQLAPGVVISITRDGSHLMLQTPGSVKYEIFPFSPTSYYLRFNNLEFHFITDDTGRVTHLALGADRARTAARIVPPS